MTNTESGGSGGPDLFDRYITTPTRACAFLSAISAILAVQLVVVVFRFLTSDQLQSTTDPGQLLVSAVALGIVVFAAIAAISAVGAIGSATVSAWNKIRDSVVA